MTDQEFDRYLEETIDCPPPADLSHEFTPWRGAMNRILWGTVWTTLTLNLLYLDVILPAAGWIMLVLGYRALRRENLWFRLAYGISWLRLGWWVLNFALHATIYSGEPRIEGFLTAGNYAMLVPGFLGLLCLRNGIRSVQKKVGLPPHGGTGLLVWFVIVNFLAYAGAGTFGGLAAWGLLIVYVFILIDLHSLSKELDEAGYAISPAPVRFSDTALKRAYTAGLLLALLLGFVFLGSYPMDWQPFTASESQEALDVRRELLDLGFPAHILDDLTEEDLLSCKGAKRVKVEVNDHPINNGREVREEDSDGVIYITTVYDQKELRLTGIAVELPGEREQWKLFHHFQWVIDPGFRGTEVIQLWPAYRSDEKWEPSGSLSGQVLYDHKDRSYSSPYHCLEHETYTDNTIFWGPRTSTDVFAEFSLPNRGENQRGYVSYTIAALEDGWSIDSWINYAHQTLWPQYPILTAKEKMQTQKTGSTLTFKTLQDALQFFPPEESQP